MPRDEYLEPYRRASKSFGDDFKVTLWASQRTQEARFEAFTEMFDFTQRRVLDAGCSRGDFLVYMGNVGIECASYTGLDGVEQVILQARSRAFPRSTFIHGDFVRDPHLLASGEPDVICLSGTLNTMTFRQTLSVLRGAWDAAGQALIFNFLSDLATSRAAPQGYPAHRHDTRRLLQWATGCTGQVIYRQDYLPHGHDGTILMMKEQGES